MSITEVSPGVFSMPDSERSAFGLGYEYRRRGEPIDHNPHPTDSAAWRWFRDGWLSRRQQELAKKVEENRGSTAV